MIPRHGQIFQPEEIAPGVTRSADLWFVTYIGVQANLLRAGVAQADWFRDGIELDKRGRVRRTRRFSLPDGRYVLTRVGAQRCTVQVGYELDQQTVYEQQWREWLANRRQPDDPQPRRVGNVIYLPVRS